MESTINGNKNMYFHSIPHNFPIVFPQPSAGEGEICIDPSHLPGVGVHHAGLLPCYRRLVEQLTQDTAEVAEIVFLSGV